MLTIYNADWYYSEEHLPWKIKLNESTYENKEITKKIENKT